MDLTKSIPKWLRSGLGLIVDVGSGPNEVTVDVIEGWTCSKVDLTEKNNGLHDRMVQLEVFAPS